MYFALYFKWKILFQLISSISRVLLCYEFTSNTYALHRSLCSKIINIPSLSESRLNICILELVNFCV